MDQLEPRRERFAGIHAAQPRSDQCGIVSQQMGKQGKAIMFSVKKGIEIGNTATQVGVS